MARRPRGLTPEETELWDDVTRTVRPLRPGARRRAAVAGAAAKPDRGVIDASPQSPVPPISPPSPQPSGSLRPSPPRPPGISITHTPKPAPADRSGERRVRRGQVEIEAKLDLHGYTQDQAHAALIRFLFQAHARGFGAVLVVTGKGGVRADGEAAPGVLKRRSPEWLAAPALRAIVSGVAAAHRRHGGSGALYVFLRRPTVE